MPVGMMEQEGAGGSRGSLHRSIAHLRRTWYVAALSNELGTKVETTSLFGQPIVLFRDGDGAPRALVDRCAHRNVPLSLGRRTKQGELECAYHGWRFDGEGKCVAIPGLCRTLEARQRVDTYPTRESDGLVWIWADPSTAPREEPRRLHPIADRRYSVVMRRVEVKSSLHAAIENALDVPHTAYLHRGLFRGGAKNQIEAVVHRYRDRVEISYEGEPQPPGVVAKILSPGISLTAEGAMTHWDRFFLPSVAQVEYQLGESHFVVTSYCTPLQDDLTRMFAVASFKTPLPKAVVRAALEPFAMRIFAQDAAMLRAQTENIERFGGEQYVSTEIDVMGPLIWRLMREAEREEQRAQSDGSMLDEGAPSEADGGGGSAGTSSGEGQPQAEPRRQEPVIHRVKLEV